MPDENENPLFEFARQTITYLAELAGRKISEKLTDESPQAKIINEHTERHQQHHELVLPEEPVDMSDEEGGFLDDLGGMSQSQLDDRISDRVMALCPGPPLPKPQQYILPRGLPEGTVNSRLNNDGTNWQVVRGPAVARIVSNDDDGDYTIAEQIWDPDLATPAWINLGVTVTGTGGPTSPNGDYPRGGTYDGKVYYEIAGAAFAIWWEVAVWIISPAPGVTDPGKWSSGSAALETEYTAGPGTYTGTPTVAATTISARDISQNDAGVVDDFVFFFQLENDNGAVDTVILVTRVPVLKTDPFTKDFWFHVTADTGGWDDVDTDHDYRNRFIETAMVWDGAAPAEALSWNESYVDIRSVDGVRVSQSDGLGLQQFITKNTGANYELGRAMIWTGQASDGDFELRVEGATGNLQVQTTNYDSVYCVRVRVRAGEQLAATDDYNIT